MTRASASRWRNWSVRSFNAGIPMHPCTPQEGSGATHLESRPLAANSAAVKGSRGTSHAWRKPQVLTRSIDLAGSVGAATGLRSFTAPALCPERLGLMRRTMCTGRHAPIFAANWLGTAFSATSKCRLPCDCCCSYPDWVSNRYVC